MFIYINFYIDRPSLLTPLPNIPSNSENTSLSSSSLLTTKNKRGDLKCKT